MLMLSLTLYNLFIITVAAEDVLAAYGQISLEMA